MGVFSSHALLQIVPSWTSFGQIQAVGKNCDLHYFRESVCWNGVGMFCCAVTHLAVAGGEIFFNSPFVSLRHSQMEMVFLITTGIIIIIVIVP